MLRIGVDIGGTFTDFAAWRDAGPDSGNIMSLKVPSTPPNFARGFVSGFEELLTKIRPLSDEPVMVMHGTTVGTNTVIERSGPAIAFFTTAGFKDLLELQRLRLGQSINMFAERVPPLAHRRHVFEVDERLNGDGSVRRPLDVAGLMAAVREAVDSGATGVAVAFLHSFANPVHEQAARAEIRRAYPDLDVSLSSEIWPRIGEYERAIVCLLNAYVKRRMDSYIGEIESYLKSRHDGASLFITRSNSGAMAAKEARAFPVHTLLSGPASGVTAAQYVGRVLDCGDMLTMDMGGTSTDISLIRDGRPTVSNEAEIGDFPLMMPVTDIEAIGAGGGSIAWLEGRVLRVGPRSAGADPGPACFGRGGREPTMTDAYLLCGMIDPDKFLGGRMRLDRMAAATAMKPVAAALECDAGEAAEACITVTTANMMSRVLPYLARMGVDPDGLTLVLYGGAGGLHGPLLAAEMGMARVLVPVNPSVFCAFGGLVSDLVQDAVVGVHGIEMTPSAMKTSFAAVAENVRRWLAAQAPPERLADVRIAYSAEMRYRGQSFEILVPVSSGAAEDGDVASVSAAFHSEHERLYAHADPEAPVEWLELRARVHGSLTTPATSARPPARRGVDTALVGRRPVRLGGRRPEPVAVYDRARLDVGHRIAGPAVIEQPDTTILVPPKYRAEIGRFGEITMVRER